MANTHKLIDMTKSEDLTALSITLADYEHGGWGATAGTKFRVPTSVIVRFQIDANNWDPEKAFNEIAKVYLSYLKTIFPILKTVPIGSQISGTTDFVYGNENIKMVREAIFRAIQFACTNTNVWERTTGNNITTPSWSISNETTGWIFSSSAWGHAAWALLESTTLNEFEVCDGKLIFNGVDTNDLIADGFTTDQAAIDKIKAWMLVHSDVFGGSGTPSPDIHTGGGIDWLTDRFAGGLNDFRTNAKNYDIVKYNINDDGTNNSEGFVLLVKTPGGIREIRTSNELIKLIDAVKADVTANETAAATNATAITAANTKIDGVEAKADKNTADIAQLASDIQVIENTWTGDHLVPSNGTSDLSALQGDKGAFDFTAGKKLIVTIGAMGKAITDTKILKVGTQGSYHLVGEGVDATFGVTVADTGVLTIQNFASTGTTSIDMHGLIIKEIEQNPPAQAVIDAYTKSEADAKFELKGQGGGGVVTEFTSAKELYDSMESGTPISGSDTKHINADTAGEIIKNQHEINAGYLSEFSDNVYYMNDTTMEYRDTNLDLVTLDAAITTTGTTPATVAYSSLISPYDRIAQDQASFDATMFQDGMKIQYLFTAKGKAIRFSGNTGAKYKWQTVTKFNAAGTSAKYIRFTGDAILEINDSALSPTGTWVGHNMPYEIPLSDFMDSANRTAIVTMNFTTKPTAAAKVASIDYKTAAHFYAQREEALFKAQAKENDAKYAHNVHNYTVGDFTAQPGFLIGEDVQDFYSLKDGDLIKLDISSMEKIVASNQVQDSAALFIGSDFPVRIPNSAGSAALKYATKTNPTDTNVKENYQANDLVVEMKYNPDGSKQLNFVRWDKKAQGPGASLTKTLTVVFTDGTSEDFKVG